MKRTQITLGLAFLALFAAAVAPQLEPAPRPAPPSPPPPAHRIFPPRVVSGPLTLHAVLDRDAPLHSTTERRLTVELSPPPVPPAQLVIAVDSSGSMAASRRLTDVRAVLRAILGELGPTDRVSLIGFGDVARVIFHDLPGDSPNLTHFADGLVESGGSNLHDGLQLATRLAAPGARILLVSDGEANVGPVEPDRLIDLAMEAADRGIRIDAYSPGGPSPLLTSIAAAADGRALDRLDDPGRWLHDERSTIDEVVLRIDLPAGVEPLGFDAPHAVARPDGWSVFLGALRPHEPFRFVADLRLPAGVDPVAVVHVDYLDGNATRQARVVVGRTGMLPDNPDAGLPPDAPPPRRRRGAALMHKEILRAPSR